MKHTPSGIWLAVWAALIALALAACAPAPIEDEQAQVRAQVERLVEAVEASSPGDIEALLADDFAGPQGMDKARARAYASLMLRRYQNPRIRWSLEEMDVQEDRARVRARAVVSASGPQVPGMDFRGRRLDVEMGWRREGGDWKVVSARWSETSH